MKNPVTQGFDALNVAPALCGRLHQLQITEPTPVQAGAIPVALEGRDLIAIAQTGTGKTLAFALPMSQRLGERDCGLVLAPTRELAQQIEETYRKLGVSTALVIGGASFREQCRQLRGRVAVVIATPGRLLDHMEQRTISLGAVRIVVLDEADRMFDMGFAPAIRRILAACPQQRQTLLLSATMPAPIQELASAYLVDPVRIEVDRSGSATELVEQELHYMQADEKSTRLAEILYETPGSVLVFARTRHGARKLAKAVRLDGHTAAEIHSDRSLAQRRDAMMGFKSGHYRILVATDIAARGIDVKEISLVVNYDVPENPEDYVHRIGRTGRAGATGRSITFAMPNQHREVRDIERLLGKKLTVARGSSPTPENRPAHPAAAPGATSATTRHKRPGQAGSSSKSTSRYESTPGASNGQAAFPRPNSRPQMRRRRRPAGR